MNMNYKDEIMQLKKRLGDIEMQLSMIMESMHSNSSERIDATEDAICETTDDMTQGFADIEDAICELTEVITG